MPSTPFFAKNFYLRFLLLFMLIQCADGLRAEPLTSQEKILLREFGELGRFKYGSTWWREHVNDPYTGLLVHFGRPQVYSLSDLTKERAAKTDKREKINRVFDHLLGIADRGGLNNYGGEMAKDLEQDAVDELEKVKKELTNQLDLEAVVEPAIPNEVFFDYSKYRRAYKISGIPGINLDINGKFGSAIKFDGTGPGLLLMGDDDPLMSSKGWSNKPNMAEMWVKVPKYPEQNACIFSAGGGEGRLMVRPDGHLDFVRRNPLGRPMKGWFKNYSTEEAFENIHDIDLSVVSEDPVPVNEWFHVVLWRSETFVINVHTLHLLINGEEVANTFGTPMDRYTPFLGRYGDKTLGNRFRIGNDEEGKHPFTGLIDEVRIPKGHRNIGDNPQRPINPPIASYEWRDADASRPLDFGRPFFYQNGHKWMVGFEDSLKARNFKGDDFEVEFTNPVKEEDLPRFFTEGVRGKALLVDPEISRVRIPVDGNLSMEEGTLEFWLQPINWDNNTGRPGLPTFRIQMMRMYCEKPNGEVVSFPIKGLPNRSGGSPSVFRPGKWTFFAMTWDHPDRPMKKYRKGNTMSFFNYSIFTDPSGPREKAKQISARVEETDSRRFGCYVNDLKPLYIEFGVHKPAIGSDGLKPIIAVDEVVAHDYALSPIEVFQAQKRVKSRLERFKALDLNIRYKYGLDELTGKLKTLFPSKVGAKKVRITVLNEDGSVFAEPVTSELELGDEGAEGDAEFVFSTGKPVPMTPLTFHIQVWNNEGEIVADDKSNTWQFKPGEWRGNDLGVPTKTPPPWTPVKVERKTLSTLMTQYELGNNGLPAAIIAKGENVLANPMRLLEDGKPMSATDLTIGESEDVKAEWNVTFEGNTCTVELKGRVEFDGLTRYELDITPTTKDRQVAPIRFEIPMKPEHSTHRLFQAARNNDIDAHGKNSPDVYTSRKQMLKRAKRRFRPRRRKNRKPPTNETFRYWDFWTIMDMCSRDRGLYWFADNAKGWNQSNRLTAQEFRRDGDEHLMIMHLVPEKSTYKHEDPIVFGIIPHPAKPLPSDYRYFEKGPSPDDPDVGRIYGGTFVPLPEQPRDGSGSMSMRVYPKDGSWEAAAKAKPFMRMMMPHYKTMYLSLAWLSTRSGQYDNWRWRNGRSSKVSLCDSFVEYLSWEMDGWLQRDYYNAIYLDECYAWPCNGPNAVRSGMALEMPDGSVQPGMRLWHFRELMKRWYTLFVKYDHRPMIVGHHSRNWMYPGMVFCTTTLDGEGTPAVTRHQKRDFMDKLHFSRFEIINSPWLWGTVPFYMPAIWENGFAHKGEGTHPPWTWQIARSAIALFAHLETSTVFEVEGGKYFGSHQKALKEWGTWPSDVAFVPWYREDHGVAIPDTHKETLVSYYKDDGRVLLIVSNRKKEERDIELKLDFKKLGLPKAPSLRVVKGIYQRPEGINPWELDEETKNMNDPKAADLMGGEEEEVLDLFGGSLKDPDKIRQEKIKAHKPRLKGNKLIVPTRAHDFRLLSLE